MQQSSQDATDATSYNAICQRCDRTIDTIKAIQCVNRHTISYECIDTTDCNNLYNKKQQKLKQEKAQKLLKNCSMITLYLRKNLV